MIISSVSVYLYLSNNLKRVQNETKLEESNADKIFEIYKDAFMISRLLDAYLSCITVPLSFIIASPKRRQAIRRYFSKMYEITVLKMANF